MSTNLELSSLITSQRSALAESLVETEFSRHPDLNRRYGTAAREKSIQDANYHLAYLAEAICADDPILFKAYIAWAKVVLAKRGVLVSDLAFHLEVLKETVASALPSEMRNLVNRYVDAGLSQLPQLPAEVPTFLSRDLPYATLARRYLEALMHGERQRASSLVLQEVERGTDVRDIYEHVFQRCQYEIGRLWQMNEISVAQEHYCTAATQLVMSQLYPHIFAGEKTAGTLVATCVAGDLHEIGVRMLADFFEMEGWNTYYLGADTPIPSVVSIVVERKAQVLAVSCTMTFHVQAVKQTIAAVRSCADCRDVKIVAGGYPFNLSHDLWRSVGADGFAANAREAVDVGRELVRGTTL